MYKNKSVILATKHQKEDAIRAPLETALGCQIHVPTQYDTDRFGTFTGEIPRKLSAYDTLVQKAKEAAQQFNYRYAIASEGSFGPHPHFYFAPGDTELIAFVDLENDLIIAEIEISTETNYGHVDILTQDGYESFLEKAQFPSHGLIVRTCDGEKQYLEKGIRDLSELKIAIKKAFEYSNTIRLETDMRAMMNPSRMQVIRAVAIKLAKRIQQHCPQCDTPGFGKISTDGNLACSDCGASTALYQRKMLSCLKCEYKLYQARDDGLEFANPQYCPDCNP